MENTINGGIFPITFDFGEYSVECGASWIHYTFKGEKDGGSKTFPLPSNCLEISTDLGGKIEIRNTDKRSGSSMTFVHYEPASLKGMFDFIGRGYNLPFFSGAGAIDSEVKQKPAEKKYNKLRPCDCKDAMDVQLLEYAGMEINEDSIFVEPNSVILKFGNTTIKVPMSRFKKFASFYLEEQDINGDPSED